MFAFTGEIHRAFTAISVYDNADDVAVQNFPDRPACETFGADVTETRAGGKTGESRVGQQRDVFAEWQMFQFAGDLSDPNARERGFQLHPGVSVRSKR